jgi:hypothetical protein
MEIMTMKVRFYYTLGCHLCDLAEAMLVNECGNGVSYESFEIADSDALLERYGVRIPVVQRACDGAELDWPFDASALRRFLEA